MATCHKSPSAWSALRAHFWVSSLVAFPLLATREQLLLYHQLMATPFLGSSAAAPGQSWDRRYLLPNEPGSRSHGVAKGYGLCVLVVARLCAGTRALPEPLWFGRSLQLKGVALQFGAHFSELASADSTLLSCFLGTDVFEKSPLPTRHYQISVLQCSGKCREGKKEMRVE